MQEKLEIFCKEISTEKRETSSYVNNLLSNIFPFSQRILQEKINRTNFTGAKGRSSTKSSMVSFDPVNYGCAIEGGEYRINPFLPSVPIWHRLVKLSILI